MSDELLLLHSSLFRVHRLQLSRRPGQMSSAQHMQMQMSDALSALRASVNAGAKTIFGNA